MILTLDIETVGPPKTPEELADLVPVTSSWKEETKAAKRNDPDAQLEAWERLAVDPWELVITACCYAVDDGPIVRATTDDVLDYIAEAQPILAGHCISGFDLPALWVAAIRSGHRRGIRALSAVLNAKPWDRPIRDTHAALGYRNSYGKLVAPSLDRACRLYGIRGPAPGTISGAECPRAWAEGRHEDVWLHCEDDVARERELLWHCSRDGVGGWSPLPWGLP